MTAADLRSRIRRRKRAPWIVTTPLIVVALGTRADWGDLALALAFLMAGMGLGWWEARTYDLELALHKLECEAGERR